MAVVGLSKDDVAAQKKFKEKYKIAYPLLADPDKTLLEALGVVKEKNMYGKKVMGVVRTTFLIGADGKVEKVWNNVSPEGHPREVLESL